MVIAKFSGLTDTQSKVAETSWESLASAFTRFDTRDKKDGKLWAPIDITGPRKDENVKSVHALVLDFDDGHDWTDFITAWAELAFVVHTTYTHSDAKPKWRAIFPLETPVPASEWQEMYRRFSFALGRGCNDQTCCNPSRIYFLPSCPPGSTPFYHRNEGRALRRTDGADLRVAPTTGARPGDDFMQRTTWAEILEPHGWRLVKGCYWVRPGKDPRDGISAIADDLFYCWSSNAGVPANKAMNKFALHVYLNFDGDFGAAATDLKRKGYGSPVQAVSSSIISAIAETDSEYAASPYSEAGNAARFAQWAAPRTRYAWRLGKWLTWDGRRWKPDEKGGGSAVRLVGEWAALIRAEAAGIADTDKRKSAWGFACGLDKRNNINTCLDLAAKHELLAILPDDMDKEDHLICLENGVLDLDRMKLLDHDPDLMMTKLAPVRYSTFANCPNWEAFLARFLPDPELRRYIQKSAGYSLTGYTGEKKFFFLYGASGNNGKSTMMNVFARIMGDYCVSASAESFMLNDRGNSASNDIARLAGARMVKAAEQEGGKKLAESLVKGITGSDPLIARFLHQEFFEYIPKFKLWMMGNHRPDIRNNDDAIWDRVKLVPFEYSLPPEERDPNFARVFDNELSGIFGWMCKGYEMYRAEGLQSPKALMEAVEEYRTDSDVLGSFLEKCTRTDAFAECKSSALYEVYGRWARQAGQGVMSDRTFKVRMKERGFSYKRDMEGWKAHGLEITDSLEFAYIDKRRWSD